MSVQDPRTPGPESEPGSGSIPGTEPAAPAENHPEQHDRDDATPPEETDQPAKNDQHGAGDRPAGQSTAVGTVAPATPRRSPIWARLLIAAGAILILSSGVAFAGTKAVVSRATRNIEQRDLLGTAGKTVEQGGRDLTGPIDLLLLGVDARKRWEVNETRADTIIVLHVSASHDQAYLISIPRDTEVEVPAFPRSGYRGGTAKATEAFFHGAQNGAGWAGGAQLMALTIKRLTGISFDGAAIINFGGFKGVINALGSIPMCVRQKVTSRHMTLVDGVPRWNADANKLNGQKAPVVHRVGCREMKGWEALDYSRQRKGLEHGDYDRQQNQQQLIKAMAKKAMAQGTTSDLAKLDRLIQAAGKAFILDTVGVPLADFVFTLRGVAANDLILLRTNEGNFTSNSADREELRPISRKMFAAAKNDTLDEFVVNNPAVLVPSS